VPFKDFVRQVRFNLLAAPILLRKAQGLKHLQVTVVDDEPASRDVLVRAARSWNYPCQAAASAEEAVELLQESPTPVVVTDLRMPGRGGVWLVREIQQRWPSASVIVVTAGHETDALTQCMDAGAHHYFLKPIHFDEFHHALETTLRQHQRHNERERYRRQLEKTVTRQTQKLRRTFLSAIDSLVRLLEARDPYTSGHSLRVCDLTVKLGEKLGLGEETLQSLSLAAKLHDIGKVGLPENILNKPDRLTEEEFVLVRKHPVIGERILTPIIRNPHVRAAIRGHHERFDGQGYPDGLRGDGIPILARLIALVDSFDAMTSNRAYRQALPTEEASARLRAGAGTQFDPELVPVFVGMIQAQN
jgi:putative two-component system response regulator